MKINRVQFQKSSIATLFILIALVLFAFMNNQTSLVHAFQLGAENKPIDMIVVIDNSCSMYPQELLLEGCPLEANDPDFLRITGANLFLARLGFAENNEADYQAGIVHLGRNSRLISPLQPLRDARDALARAIANPQPEPNTKIVPALEISYEELNTSPNRRAENLRAVVLITDGKPTPAEGQSNEEIEQLIREHPDIPLFIMLLQNPDSPSREEFQQYIDFWEGVERDYEHVQTYPVESATEIADTYNRIIAELQNTVPEEGEQVSPGVPYSVFISQYVRRIEISIIHEDASNKGKVTITDPLGNEVQEGEQGVKRFSGEDNPVEVISISAPRLSDELKQQDWIVTSDQPVTVFLDRQGAYRVNFLAPKVTLSELPNLVFATEQHVPGQVLPIRFKLLDSIDATVLDAQPIQGKVINPDGQESPLAIPADLAPDGNGIYEIIFDPLLADPAVQDRPGRFTFIIEAGSADDAAGQRIPITSARLLVNIGRAPFIDSITPQPVICASGQPVEVMVTIGDLEMGLSDSLRVRVVGEGANVQLTSDGANTFSGDITELCTPLIANTSCATQGDRIIPIVLSGSMHDGAPMPINEGQMAVQVIAPACTATPPPPPTATPTPAPTAIPDSDGDGMNDVMDECSVEAGWQRFNGCPPPLWFWIAIAVGVLIIAGLAWFLIPWLIVAFFRPPPKAFVLVCKTGDRQASPKATYSVGMRNRTNRVTIGGDKRRAHIYVAGLKPIEFMVVQQGNQVLLLDENGTRKSAFSERENTVRTSQADIRLKISLDRQRVSRC